MSLFRLVQKEIKTFQPLKLKFITSYTSYICRRHVSALRTRHLHVSQFKKECILSQNYKISKFINKINFVKGMRSVVSSFSIFILNAIFKCFLPCYELLCVCVCVRAHSFSLRPNDVT